MVQNTCFHTFATSVKDTRCLSSLPTPGTAGRAEGDSWYAKDGGVSIPQSDTMRISGPVTIGISHGTSRGTREMAVHGTPHGTSHADAHGWTSGAISVVSPLRLGSGLG